MLAGFLPATCLMPMLGRSSCPNFHQRRMGGDLHACQLLSSLEEELGGAWRQTGTWCLGGILPMYLYLVPSNLLCNLPPAPIQN